MDAISTTFAMEHAKLNNTHTQKQKLIVSNNNNITSIQHATQGDSARFKMWVLVTKTLR